MPETHGNYDTLVRTTKKILIKGKKVVRRQISPKNKNWVKKSFFSLTPCDHKNYWVCKCTKCVVNILDVLATKCILIWVYEYRNFASKLVGSHSISSRDAFFRRFFLDFGPVFIGFVLTSWCKTEVKKSKVVSQNPSSGTGHKINCGDQ